MASELGYILWLYDFLNFAVRIVQVTAEHNICVCLDSSTGINYVLCVCLLTNLVETHNHVRQ